MGEWHGKERTLSPIGREYFVAEYYGSQEALHNKLRLDWSDPSVEGWEGNTILVTYDRAAGTATVTGSWLQFGPETLLFEELLRIARERPAVEPMPRTPHGKHNRPARTSKRRRPRRSASAWSWWT